MSFLDEVKEEAGSQLCKIGTFIANQNLPALEKAGKDPLTDEDLITAKQNFSQEAVLTALRKRGLATSADLLRKHITQICACATKEPIV